MLRGVGETWRPLASERPIRRLLLLSGIAQVHVGGLTLAVLLATEQATGSLAAAGVMAGLLSVGVGLTRPAQGRLLDSLGMRALIPVALIHTACAGAFLAAITSHAGAAVLVPLSFMLGFSTPAISVTTRAFLTRHVREVDWAAAFGTDTAVGNVAFAVGPLVVGALSATTGTAAALVAAVLVGCTGSVVMALAFTLASPMQGRRPIGVLHGLRPIGSALVCTAALGTVYGATSTMAVAVALEAQRPELSGALVAVLFAGGIFGDLVLVPRRPDVPLAARLRGRLRWLLVATILLTVAPGSLGFAAMLVAGGAALSCATVTAALDVAARARSEARAEAFGWTGAILRLGNAAGTAGAGIIAEDFAARAPGVLAVGGAGAALAVVVFRSRRARIRPRDRAHEAVPVEA